MTKKTNLADIPETDINFWNVTLNLLANKIRRRVQELRQNHKGQKFKGYSEQYRKYKTNNMRIFTTRETESGIL